eukprot:1807910-Lingulodinium_polyedra.AAC.1
MMRARAVDYMGIPPLPRRNQVVDKRRRLAETRDDARVGMIQRVLAAGGAPVCSTSERARP